MIDRRTFLGVLTSALFVPLAAGAQPPGPVRTVAILGHASATSFEAGLHDLGWIEGTSVRFERRFSTDDGTLEKLAVDLSRIPVDVIFAGNAPATRAAMKATRAIPIITVSADPVGTGFVASLARPGGNVTGVAIMHTELSGKRIEILAQTLPTARRVAFLANSANPSTPAVRRETEARARALGVTLLPLELRAPKGLGKTLAALGKAHPDALVVQADPLFNVIRTDLIKAAARLRLPAMWESRVWVEDGGLMSYGPNVGAELYRRAAVYADRILKGAKPGDLPVEQSTKSELVINAKTVKALGLTISPSLLARADQVIE